MNLIDYILSNVSINLKLNLFCRHEQGWNEYKTKADYTLWCVQEGSLTIELNEKTFFVQKGDVVLFYPGDSYHAYSDVDCAFLVFFFSLETGNSMDLLKGMNLAGVYHNEHLRKTCLSFCEHYLNYFDTPSSVSLQLYASFFSFVTELLKIPECCNHFYEMVVNAPDTLIHSVLSYMNEHFTEDILMKELAALVDMSEKYFIRYFHFHIGITPKQYLVELRMKRAIELLSSTNCSIAEIASELGYSDQYCFSKAFRKYYGEAPSTFRRNIL